MKKRVLTTVLAMLVASCIFTLSACGATRETLHKQGDAFTIGLSMATLKEERWYIDRNEFVARAKEYNANVIVDVAYDDPDEQYKQVKDMIAQGIDVLVLIPYDATSASVIVAAAKNAGIKVISYDRLVLNANVDLYISFDNVKVGELQATEILKAAPSGNYVIVDGPVTDYNATMINEGIKSVLAPHIASKKIKIIKEFSTFNWMADEASDGVNKLLTDSVKIDAVIAENDSLAGGVINTLSQYHMVPAVPVVGMDADLAACQRVAEGQQLMTVYKPIKKLAAAAADFAAQMVYGQSAAVNDTISDGKYYVPFYKIEPIAVNRSNLLDTVIRDGFHRIDEVYMNVSKDKWPKE